MRRFFRKIARWCVTIYANNIYKSVVKSADERLLRQGKKQYAIIDPTSKKRMRVFNGDEFRFNKRCFHIRSIYDTIPHMKKGCFYYTPDKFGKGGMTAREIEVRRLAFVRQMLFRAKLTKEWDRAKKIERIVNR